MNGMEVIQRVRDDMARIGWSVMGIGGSEAMPQFCYTCGLTALGHPEIVVVGNFSPNSIMAVLNGMGFKIKEQGIVFSEGWYDTIIKNFSVPLLEVTPEGLEMFGMCRRVFGENGFRGLQLFLPDAEGNFPDDVGCAPNFAQQVKLCGREPIRRRILN